MEIAFDGFWEKHQLKMEQYLQLWKFEQDFQVRSVKTFLGYSFIMLRFLPLIIRNTVLQDAGCPCIPQRREKEASVSAL